MDYEMKNVMANGELIGINKFGNLLIRDQNGMVETLSKGKLKW